MKVSVILTFVSLCLAELAKAAPVARSAAPEIVDLNEKGKEINDFKSVLPLIRAIDKKIAADGENSITEEDEKLMEDLIAKIQEQGLMKELLSEPASASWSEGFEAMSAPEEKPTDDEVSLDARGEFYTGKVPSETGPFEKFAIWIYREAKKAAKGISKWFETTN